MPWILNRLEARLGAKHIVVGLQTFRTLKASACDLGSANTWAAVSNTNWAASSAGANNATVPGTSDLPIFDSNSGTGNSVIAAAITVQGLDCTGGTGNYAGTITHNTTVTLTINTGAASSLRFTSGMTYTAASASALITFTHTLVGPFPEGHQPQMMASGWTSLHARVRAAAEAQ